MNGGFLSSFYEVAQASVPSMIVWELEPKDLVAAVAIIFSVAVECAVAPGSAVFRQMLSAPVTVNGVETSYDSSCDLDVCPSQT